MNNRNVEHLRTSAGVHKILIRDVFQRMFGKTQDALATLKDVGDAVRGMGYGGNSFRLLTDLIGPYDAA